MTDADVWMPLYIGDYLRDTAHLSASEHGAYLLLIMECWSKGGSVTDSDRALWRVVRADSLEHWQTEIRPALEPFFQVGDGVWQHKRVSEELATARNQKEKQRQRTAAARKAREEKRGATEPVTESNTTSVTDTGTKSPSPSPSPIDSFGDAKPPEPEPPAKPKRGSRLPTGFTVPPDWIADGHSAREKHRLPPANLELEAENFVAYWAAKSGKDATKLDWHATWLTWCRRSNAPPRQRDGPNGHQTDFLDGEIRQWKHRMNGFNQSGFWLNEQWGPPPGQPGCQVPRELVDGDAA